MKFEGILNLPSPYGFTEEPHQIKFECVYDDYKVKRIKMIHIDEFGNYRYKITLKEFKQTYKKDAKELILEFISDPKNIK